MVKIRRLIIVLAVVCITAGTAYSGSAELRYAMSALKTLAGYDVADSDADMDGNGKIGVEDVICGLQIAAGLRLSNPDIVLAVPEDTDRLKLAWLPVSDDSTTADKITYEVHLSKDEKFQPSPATLKATVAGETQKEITGLETGTAYYALVIAADPDGNRSTKRDYRQITTFSEPAVVSSTTKFNEDENLGLTGATQDGSNYIYPAAADAKLPEVGSLLFSKVGEDTYLRKVEAVNTVADTVVVQTGDAELAEVLEQATVSSEIKMFDIDEAAGRSAHRSDIDAKRSVRSDGSRHSVIRWKDELLVAEQTDYASKNDEVSVSPGLRSGEHVIRISKDSEESAGVNAGVTFTPRFESRISWKKDPLKGITISSGSVIAKGTLSANIDAFYNFKGSASFEKEIKLFSRSFGSVYFVGAVPVYQRNTLTLKAVVKASASSEIQANANAGASASIQIGARYNPATEAWEVIPPSPSFEKSFTADISLHGGVHGEVRLIPNLEVEYYRMLAIDISVEPFLTGDIEAELMGKADILEGFGYLKAQLTKFEFALQAEAFVGVSFGIFSKKFPLLGKTQVYQSPRWVLFSLPKLEVSGGSGKVGEPISLTATTTDGAKNPFDNGSIRWDVYPNKGSLTQGSSTTTFTPSEIGTYTIFFSGHSRLGDPFGRQFVYAEVNADGAFCEYTGDPYQSGYLWEECYWEKTHETLKSEQIYRTESGFIYQGFLYDRNGQLTFKAEWNDDGEPYKAHIQSGGVVTQAWSWFQPNGIIDRYNDYTSNRVVACYPLSEFPGTLVSDCTSGECVLFEFSGNIFNWCVSNCPPCPNEAPEELDQFTTVADKSLWEK
jgi:hypothetical protein